MAGIRLHEPDGGGQYSFAPMAAIAAERAVAVALYDEFLLEPRYADADDTDLDSYDRDAAWCASLAWAGQDEEAGPGERNVAELKFWVWYLERASRLLGLEDWKFPKKAIKAFEEKQELARPVPEEVSLESLTDFLGQGSIDATTVFEKTLTLEQVLVTRITDMSFIRDAGKKRGLS